MFTSGETLLVNNLMCLRRIVKVEELPQLAQDMMRYIERNGGTVVGPVITTTHGADQATGTLDFEVFYPCDKRLPETNGIVYKEKIHIKNCIKASHKGNPQDVQQTYAQLEKILLDNKLKTSSPSFNVNMSPLNDSQNFHMDIYVSVNDNIY